VTFRVLILSVLAVVGLAACSGADGEPATPLPPTETTVALSSTTTTTSSTLPTATTTTSTLPGPTHPFTGRPGEASGLRPLIAKISNAPAGRPQAGIAEADLVMEVLVEGGIGRWLAVYQSAYPEVVGPVRSLREVDPRLVAPFDARVISSGGQARVRSELARVGEDEGDGRVPGYFREAGRKQVYDLMYDVSQLPVETWNGEPAALFEFAEAEAEGEAAGTIEVAMSGLNQFTWSFEEGRYVRGQDGQDMVDADGNPITADNVVVVFVEQFFTGRVDANNSAVPDYLVLGDGQGVLFRDGLAYPMEWVRSDESDFFTFSVDGQELPMAPGRTWLHFTPIGRIVSW
jgi:hypothetical protein